MISLKKINFLFVFFLFTGTSFSGRPKKYEIKTVVIDAGHGGHDTGCLGASGKEKDVALEISLKLGKLIQENYPAVKVIYTRKTDVFVELHERAEIANRNKADLFICIHANSGGAAYGTETFVLGLHRAEENLAVSKRENSAILMEKDYKTKYDGFDPNSPEANIIFRLYQSTYLQQSLLFAAKIQDQLNDYAGRLNRGVKQAGLLVLARTTMPGVLIESGFLTNISEEKYLLSSKGQNQIATSIYRAFKEYKIDMEETPESNNVAILKEETALKEVVSPVKDSSAKNIERVDKSDKNSLNNEKKESDESFHAKDPLPPSKINKQPKANTDSSKIPNKNLSHDKNEIREENIKKPVPAKTEGSLSDKKNIENPLLINESGQPKTSQPETREVFFTIQLGSMDNPTLKDRERFKKIQDIQERKGEDGMVRFTTGIFYSLDKAINGQNEMRNNGFKDAFVTAYQKNKRITIKEAILLSGGK